MRSRPPPRDFGTGELDPRLDGITNEITARGVRTLENWIVRKTGSAVRRPGTFFAGEVKDSSDAIILVPVEIDTTNSFVLELGDTYIRFWQQSTHAVVGAPYEVTSPWSTGELSDLRWQYIPDEKAVYWVHPAYAMRKLAFTSAADWSLTQAHTDAFQNAVAVTYTGRIYRTDDFTHWESDRLNITTSDTREIYRSGVASTKIGLFLVPDFNNSAVYISGDSHDWVSAGPDTTGPLTIKVDKYGIIVLGGNGTNDLWVSEDGGLGWDQQTNPTISTAAWQAIAIDPVNNRWRIAGGAPGTQGAKSFDGRTWSSVPGPALGGTGGGVRDMEGYNDFWVAVGLSGIKYSGSVTAGWTTAVSVTNHSFQSVVYDPGTPLWVVAKKSDNTSGGFTGSGTIYISTTGTSWTVALTTSQSLSTVVWVRSRFYVFGTGQNYYVSDDGTDWQTITEASFIANTNDGITGLMYDEPEGAEWFDEADHYPKDITFHEQRLVIGPTVDEPSTIWASKTGRFSNFYLGDLANEGWSYKLTGDRNVDILWIMGGQDLVVGTRTEEIVLRGQQGIGISPNGVQALKQSTFGSSAIKPVRIHNTIVFVQRGGEVVRGYVPAAGTDAWQSPDLTYNAGHVTEGGVIQLAHQDDPQTILYAVREDGELLALTYHPPNVVAWSRIVTDGEFESIAVVPTSGAEDEIWAVVKRTVNSVTKRYIEYFSTLNVASQTAAHYVDCGVSLTEGATFATMGALTHLAGEIVDVLVDGNEWLSGLTVAASGTIVFTAGYSGTTAHAGLPYTSKIETMRGDWGSPWGSGAGITGKLSKVLLWVHDSLGGFMGPTFTLADETILPLSSTASLETDIVDVNFPGQFDQEKRMWVVVTQPTPFEVVGLLPDVESGDR